jgi:hypothetical protein
MLMLLATAHGSTSLLGKARFGSLVLAPKILHMIFSTTLQHGLMIFGLITPVTQLF